ncbi:hypothetical protein BB560_001546, partial [Smittium megazygosporum]
CKFGLYCTRPNCVYSHPTRNLSLVNTHQTPSNLVSQSNEIPHISNREFAFPSATLPTLVSNENQISVMQSSLNSGSAGMNTITNVGLNSQPPNIAHDSSLHGQEDNDDVIMNI